MTLSRPEKPQSVYFVTFPEDARYKADISHNNDYKSNEQDEKQDPLIFVVLNRFTEEKVCDI